MSWWWDSYIHPNDLYYHYKGLAGFVPLDRWLPAVPEKVTVDTDVPGDLIVSPTLGWGATPERPYWIVNPSVTSGPRHPAARGTPVPARRRHRGGAGVRILAWTPRRF